MNNPVSFEDKVKHAAEVTIAQLEGKKILQSDLQILTDAVLTFWCQVSCIDPQHPWSPTAIWHPLKRVIANALDKIDEKEKSG